MTCLTYRVSADHLSPKFRLDDLVIEVSYDGHDPAGRPFSAYASSLGCSKSAETPERAIRVLVSDHGCTNIRMQPIAEAEPRDPRLGETVEIISGTTGRKIGLAVIASISPAGRKVDVLYVGRPQGRQRQFYRQGRGFFVENPGSGLAGRLLNDQFVTLNRAPRMEFMPYWQAINAALAMESRPEVPYGQARDAYMRDLAPELAAQAIAAERFDAAIEAFGPRVLTEAAV